MKFGRYKNKPWKKCCNDCIELENCCYICNDIDKEKNYIKL